MKESWEKIVKVCGSNKRILILEIIVKNKKIRWKELSELMHMENRQSEVYKHLKVLMENGFIIKNERRYSPTLGGEELIDFLTKFNKRRTLF